MNENPVTNKKGLPSSSTERLKALFYPEIVAIFQFTATLWHFREITLQ